MMQYVFTEAALVRIETQAGNFGRDVQTFYLSIPSLDAAEYKKEFDNGLFAIADLKSFVRTYTFLTRRLRDMKKRGESSWVSSEWIAGRG
jgi:hypothetical protein